MLQELRMQDGRKYYLSGGYWKGRGKEIDKQLDGETPAELA